MIAHIAAIALISAGLFLTAVATIGVLRLPDFYTRLHASGKAEGLGVLMAMAGLAVYNGMSLTSIKIVVIAVFIMLANPIATHILARAAHRAGLPLWTKKGE